jgi:hypothetical protein
VKQLLTACALAVAAVALSSSGAVAVGPYVWLPQGRASMYNWHANYAYTDYGAPTALVVPPTAQLQTDWSWGAPSMRVSRIDHQFTRNYPGPAPFGAGFRHTPAWPQDTAQFGVYYVRGPWWPTQSGLGKYHHGCFGKCQP